MNYHLKECMDWNS